MAKLYKSLKFNNFSGGQGQKFITDPEAKITKCFRSSNVQLDRLQKKLKLAFDFDNFEQAGDMAGLITDFTLTYFDTYLLFAIEKIGGNVEVYKSDNILSSSDFSLQGTIVDGHTPYFAATFKNLYLLWFDYDGTESVGWSDDGGANFTLQAWTYGKILDSCIGEDGYLYILTADYILRATTGYSWAVYYDGTADKAKLTALEEMDGFIYAVRFFEKDKTTKYFIRFENDLPVNIQTFPAGDITNSNSMHKFDSDKIVLLNNFGNVVEIWEYDKIDLAKIGQLDEQAFNGGHIIGNDVDKMYIAVRVDTGEELRRRLYTLDRNGALFLEHTFIDDHNICGMINFVGKVWLQIMDIANNKIQIYNSSISVLYPLSGYVETPIATIGKIIPCHLLLRHLALTANESVKVYVKKNRAASWGTAVITSDVDGDVYAEYSFPGGTIYDDIQIKAELITADTAKTPSEVEFELLYIPTGLPVATE